MVQGRAVDKVLDELVEAAEHHLAAGRIEERVSEIHGEARPGAGARRAAREKQDGPDATFCGALVDVAALELLDQGLAHLEVAGGRRRDRDGRRDAEVGMAGHRREAGRGARGSRRSRDGSRSWRGGEGEEDRRGGGVGTSCGGCVRAVVCSGSLFECKGGPAVGEADEVKVDLVERRRERDLGSAPSTRPLAGSLSPARSPPEQSCAVTEPRRSSPRQGATASTAPPQVPRSFLSLVIQCVFLLLDACEGLPLTASLRTATRHSPISPRHPPLLGPHSCVRLLARHLGTAFLSPREPWTLSAG